VKYLLLICTEDDAAAKVSTEDLDARADEWSSDLERRGKRVTGDRLRPPSDATTVRVRDGGVLVSDGPYAETKEQMGGFDVIEAADLDEAIEIVAAHPMARYGMIEIRPFWPM
jgi:hypothetical protein